MDEHQKAMEALAEEVIKNAINDDGMLNFDALQGEVFGAGLAHANELLGHKIEAATVKGDTNGVVALERELGIMATNFSNELQKFVNGKLKLDEMGVVGKLDVADVSSPAEGIVCANSGETVICGKEGVGLQP